MYTDVYRQLACVSATLHACALYATSSVSQRIDDTIYTLYDDMHAMLYIYVYMSIADKMIDDVTS